MVQSFREYISNNKHITSVNEKKLIDIRQAIADGTVKAHWGYGLAYEGNDLYKLHKRINRALKKSIREEFDSERVIVEFDGQEVYLGYDKKKDEFLSGWNCTMTEKIRNEDYDFDDEDYDGDEYIYEDIIGEAIARFKINKGKLKIIDVEVWFGYYFFEPKGGEIYRTIKKNKNIVEIRSVK